MKLDEVRGRQVPADRIRGALVYGWTVEPGDEDGLVALDAEAQAAGLALYYGGGDAENAEDDHLVSLFPWVLGVEVAAVSGGEEQAAGFDYATLAARIGSAKQRLAGLGRAEAPALRLVAAGGLALASLVKGRWLDAPDLDEDDPETSLYDWIGAQRPYASTGELGFRHGTRGSSQAPYPGGVEGICVEAADQESVEVTLGPDEDAALDRTLAAAGLTDPRYFLLTRYD